MFTNEVEFIGWFIEILLTSNFFIVVSLLPPKSDIFPKIQDDALGILNVFLFAFFFFCFV